jgi:hypothetical protein
LKTALAALAAALPLFTLAADGPADGIYFCSSNAGGRVSSQYITMNGQPDGRTIFAVAATTPTQAFYGYGIGSVSGSSFAGTTSHGGHFNITITSTGAAGVVGVYVSGTFVNAQVSCTKVW